VNIDKEFRSLLEKCSKQRKAGDIKVIESITKVTSTRKSRYKPSVQERYYPSSLKEDAKKLSFIIRSHWHMENKLHWT
jgi:predicted transposase YbfD/YdcC